MGNNNQTIFLIAAIFGPIGSIAAAILGAWLTSKHARRAQDEAARQNMALESAKREATESTRRLLEEARNTESRVAGISRDVAMSHDLLADTHRLVNGRTKELLRECMLLAERIAREHPQDEYAQSVAKEARREYESHIGLLSPEDR